LNDPTATPQQQFQVWRDAMSPEVSDEEVRDLMIKAKERMQALVKPKKGVTEFAMTGGGDGEDPTDNYPCYDCGSTIFLHHTKLCELAEDNAVRDLPARPRSQHWTGEVPKGLQPIPGLEEGVLEGPNDGKEDNFTIDDIKRLEKIRDLETLKAQAKELIKGKPVRRMKPEKISWFYNHIDTLKNPLAVIKMMYDLMLAGEGNKVIGSRNSMSSNSYRTRFGEQGVVGAELDDQVEEKMLPASAFAGTPKNKLGPAAHLKGSMKRPARAGDLVGGVEEGLGSKLAGLGLAGAMAFGAGGANARVSGDQDPSINRLTGKPNVTQSVPANVKPAATTPAGFNKEYLQSVIDGKHPRPLISKEKAADILMKMNAVDEAKIKGADGKACWKGYKYAGTKNGKDKCVPIGEAYETEMYKAIALLESK
jgi:hypothetical protein